MDKETFTEKIKEIGSMESIEEVRAGLVELSNNVSDIYDTNTTLTEQHEADIKEMEAIRQANMKLFTQLGSEKTPVKQAEEQTGLKQEPVERRTFDNLLSQLDEKGNKLFK